MSRLVRAAAIGAVTLFGWIGAPADAFAQASASDKAAAESLFDRGLALMRDGKFQEACQVLEQSQTIERGIGTMLYLAECYEKLGRTASAWALFREAASEARAGGQGSRAEAGAARAAALEPKLSKLTVLVDPKNVMPGFELLRDGQPMSPGTYGAAVPVDPGEHRLEARAPGYLPWSGTARVGLENDSASIGVPELQVDTSKPAEPVSEPPPIATPISPATPEQEPSRSSPQRTAGLVIGGVGVVALGIGSYFGLSALGKKNDAEEKCPSDPCGDKDGVELTEDAKDAATMSNVFVFGGAALAATGIVLYLTAPSPTTPTASVSSDGRSLKLSVGGAF
jgi:hypothetical protein